MTIREFPIPEILTRVIMHIYSEKGDCIQIIITIDCELQTKKPDILSIQYHIIMQVVVLSTTKDFYTNNKIVSQHRLWTPS